MINIKYGFSFKNYSFIIQSIPSVAKTVFETACYIQESSEVSDWSKGIWFHEFVKPRPEMISVQTGIWILHVDASDGALFFWWGPDT